LTQILSVPTGIVSVTAELDVPLTVVLFWTVAAPAAAVTV
jgi:hypothetical protein